MDRAASGDRADYLARTEEYDAVLLDLGLPRVDGLTLLRQWREGGLLMPVLVLTARGSWTEKVHGIDSGADDYVAKPYRVEEVLARTRALIRRAHGHAAPQLRCGGVTLDPRLAAVTLNGAAVTLTSHEVPDAVVPDAPAGACGVTQRAHRAHLRPELRARLQHRRGVRGAAAPQAGAVGHRDGAGPGLPHARGAARDGSAGVKGRSSFRSQLAIGSVLWTFGLLVFISMLAIHLLASNPRPHQFVYRLFFDSPMVVVLVVAAAAMVGGAWQIRRSIGAMTALHSRLTAVHRGEHHEVTGRYPSEVQPLVDDLNALLSERDKRVQRALAKAGDLAHGLKTPLAVLARDAERVSASGDHELAASMAAQVERMRRQIDYHLVHARAAAAGTGPGTRSLVASSVDGLIRTLERLHAERSIALRSAVSAGHAVRCRREDLDEMLGNLLDNACKWATITRGGGVGRGGFLDRHDGGRRRPRHRSHDGCAGARARRARRRTDGGHRAGPGDRPRSCGDLRRVDRADAGPGRWGACGKHGGARSRRTVVVGGSLFAGGQLQPWLSVKAASTNVSRAACGVVGIRCSC